MTSLSESKKERNKTIQYILLPLIIFLFAFALRVYFFSGFILGDDALEFAVLNSIIGNGPDFHDQLVARFGGWIFNYLSFKLFGVSETAFFLPSWIFSSSLSVMAYFIFVLLRYGTMEAFLGGFLVASAPFEILIGTARANDLFLGWAMALGLLFIVLYEKKPVRQGIVLAVLLWYGFYVKLYAVYAFPALGLYYLSQILQNKKWSGLFSFTATSVFLHGITIIFWKIKVGEFLPFISTHAATYPVPVSELRRIFLEYPKMIFQGSEFGTTLFGIVPYLLLGLLLLKVVLTFSRKRFPDHIRLDRFDLYLFVLYGSFFLLLNFFPSSFKFDQYYSPGRIFRYLAPLSFPMTLHLAKLILDFSRIFVGQDQRPASNFAWGSMVLVPLILINIYQADDATKPGQIYQKILSSIIEDIKKDSPPKLVVTSHLGVWLKDLYLKKENGRKPFLQILYRVYTPKEHEEWLDENQPALPEGTLLITGFGTYVHYGARNDGFLLGKFSHPLDPHWQLVKNYGMLSYLPSPVPVQLWRLQGKITEVKAKTPPPSEDPIKVEKEDNFNILLKTGMDYFGKEDYKNAKIYFQKAIQNFPIKADEAYYFYTICYFREGNWEKTVAEFKKMIQDYPKSPWISAAHYHIGVSYKQLNNTEQAREEFHYIIDHFPNDTNTVRLSKEQLKELGEEPFGIMERLYKRLFADK